MSAGIYSTVSSSGSTLVDGMVSQTAHTTYRSEVTDNTGDWTAIDNNTSTGYVASLTPTSSNSKLLIRCKMHFGADQPDDSRWYGIRLYKKIGSGAWTHISGADGDGLGGASGTTCFIVHTWGAEISNDYGFQVANLSGEYLDDATNSTDVHYYTLYWKCRLGATTANKTRHLNRASSTTASLTPLTSSSISIQEIYYS